MTSDLLFINFIVFLFICILFSTSQFSNLIVPESPLLLSVENIVFILVLGSNKLKLLFVFLFKYKYKKLSYNFTLKIFLLKIFLYDNNFVFSTGFILFSVNKLITFPYLGNKFDFIFIIFFLFNIIIFS